MIPTGGGRSLPTTSVVGSPQIIGPSARVWRTLVNKKCQVVPKTAPVWGTLRAEYRTCGKSACRCTRGDLHGPYSYHRWREGGRQRRRYVRAEDAEAVRAVLAEWRRLHPPARTTRDLLADLNRLTRGLNSLEG